MYCLNFKPLFRCHKPRTVSAFSNIYDAANLVNMNRMSSQLVRKRTVDSSEKEWNTTSS